jgi:hypothetical protein
MPRAICLAVDLAGAAEHGRAALTLGRPTARMVLEI